ncbi:hypothetical protein EDD86DRAFT_191382 [Gorgonomyces haynaldii]|nr:hypothetical protein EDD86DRAFT_191382 [Gorgonomyces haynaldii]
MNRSEVFLFDYGIIVMWNFTQMEEIVLVEKMRKFAIGFDDSYEVIPEEFHFQYELSTSKQARIFNDMITLKSSSPLMKLTISHGLAQSVKLSIYENIIDETIQGTIPISKMMAKYGKVKMSRSKIMKIVGQLYRLKMNVNLVSNVLDKPEFFWSEPRLEPLYIAVRSYLEIPQRVELLNKRADVLTDLLEMLTDHMNSNEMTYITWIVIILVFLAAVTALSEVGVKLLRLQAGLN